VIGFVYPFYKSILSLESKDSEQTTKWLIYWILYSTITVLEEYAALVIYWIPFYYPLKASFLVYIMVPQFTGAQYVYYVIKPYFSGIIGDKIDASLSSAGSKEE
jgi:receptor expression-enhancing protein 5/6